MLQHRTSEVFFFNIPITEMTIHHSLVSVLASPVPEDIWRLRADLLGTRPEIGCELIEILREFHNFLYELIKSSTSREYSHFASKLDIGAVGALLLENILEDSNREKLGKKLLGALFSEGLMVLATRQHVKAWEEGLGAVYRRAAWFLYEQVWKFSMEARPELESSQRRKLLDQLMAPVTADETSGEVKAVICGRLFQILLIWILTKNLERSSKHHCIEKQAPSS